MGFEIRKASVTDVDSILELVNELAIFEKAPEQVTNTRELMIKEGFGANPAFECFLGILDGKVVGMSLYFFRYSTWKGRRLYLEDLIITQSQRGGGFGKKLFDITIEEAKKQNCSGMMWQVLDWNTPAIEFYKSYGARLDDEWINCHLDF